MRRAAKPVVEIGTSFLDRAVPVHHGAEVKGVLGNDRLTSRPLHGTEASPRSHLVSVDFHLVSLGETAGPVAAA